MRRTYQTIRNIWDKIGGRKKEKGSGGVDTGCPEEITNGGFEGNSDGWKTANATITVFTDLPSNNWAYGSNNAEHTPSSLRALVQVGTLVEGASYIVKATIGGTTQSVSIKLDGGGAEIFAAGVGEVTFTAVYTFVKGVTIIIAPIGGSSDVTITNVSVKAVSC